MNNKKHNYVVQADNPYGSPQPGAILNSFNSREEAQKKINKILKMFDKVYIPKTKDGSMTFGNKSLDELIAERQFIEDHWKIVKV